MLTHLSNEQLILRGHHLRAQLIEIERELNEIETTLKNRALSLPHHPLADESREGRRAIISEGTQQISVVFTSDLLKKTFASDSVVANQLSSLFLNHQELFYQLFKIKSSYERKLDDANQFRAFTHEILPDPIATSVIELLKEKDRKGITKSKIVVEWEDKKTKGARK